MSATPDGIITGHSAQNETAKQPGHSGELARQLRDIYPLHTPNREEDVQEGLGTVEEAPETPEEHTHRARPSAALCLSLGITALVAVIAFIIPDQFFAATTEVRNAIGNSFGWYYLVLVFLTVVACIAFALSPAGAIRLGDPTDKPRFSTLSWIAMLFSAGMGIGLVFWGAAEPLAHFATNSPEAPVGSYEALRDAFRYSFFHWGFSAWAVYAVVALALGYFHFRKKERALLSVTLKPLFGKRAEGVIGTIVDALTAFATVVGVGVSLGMGATQINSGLNYLFGIPQSITVQLIIIAAATVAFLISALSGLTKGIRLLSNTNVVLATALVAICVVLGPTVQIFNAFTAALGSYVQNFISMSLNIAPYDMARQEWIQQWTVFYWAWWIAWSPFVGVFIARISRGRTIREFIIGVVLVPTVFACIWFATFGTISTGMQIGGLDLASLPAENVLFASLLNFPAGIVLAMVALVLILSFFVTSADSATFVLGMVTERGSLTPRKLTKFIWGVLLSVLASVLLAAGGLDALQNVLIITALPFSFVILLIIASLAKELRHERLMMGLYVKPTAYPEPEQPFRSYEDDAVPNPVEDVQQRISTFQALAEMVSDAAGDEADGDGGEDGEAHVEKTVAGEDCSGSRQ